MQTRRSLPRERGKRASLAIDKAQQLCASDLAGWVTPRLLNEPGILISGNREEPPSRVGPLRGGTPPTVAVFRLVFDSPSVGMLP